MPSIHFAIVQGKTKAVKHLGIFCAGNSTMTYSKAIIIGLAEVAQLVEQLIRNEKVGGSIPLFGTILKKRRAVVVKPFCICCSLRFTVLS
jgi:hypothetical protein